jgi:SAM-dependent methyltransferase
MEDQVILDEQLSYYRARAPEYDEWFMRTGRYDRGPEHRAEWFREVAKIEAALEPVIEDKDVVELACGTGRWAKHLARLTAHTLAVDAAPEAIELNRKQLGGPNVEYCLADIFSWEPPRQFDVVFFSFWLSHIPRWRLDSFWRTVRLALKGGGSAFFIDSLFEPTSTAIDHRTPDHSGTAHRKLNDGREFRIVKVFYEPAVLEKQLIRNGWHGWVRSSGNFFLYGNMSPISPCS